MLIHWQIKFAEFCGFIYLPNHKSRKASCMSINMLTFCFLISFSELSELELIVHPVLKSTEGQTILAVCAFSSCATQWHRLSEWDRGREGEGRRGFIKSVTGVYSERDSQKGGIEGVRDYIIFPSRPQTCHHVLVWVIAACCREQCSGPSHKANILTWGTGSPLWS